MGRFLSDKQYSRYVIFLNISFLSVACVFFYIHHSSAKFLVLNSYDQPLDDVSGDEQNCTVLHSLKTFKAKCFYLRANSCVSQGYIDYLYLFYCHFGKFPFLGHFLLFLWLLVLFYLLGNTASEYFCSSLEDLSRLLKLSPTIAGVTLLSLGNGANDVFSSFVSFMGNGTDDVGFNTVLGGASFITCVVVGAMSILVRKKGIEVNRRAFVRDICFFLLVIASVIFTVIVGEINLWGAFGFLSMYLAYVVVVYITDVHWAKDEKGVEMDPNSNDLSIPILPSMEKDEVHLVVEGDLEGGIAVGMKQYWLWLRPSACCYTFLHVLELPLYLPRRMTIPVVSDKNWSKPIAVASVVLAPILLSTLWSLQEKNGSIKTYGIGCLFGIVFGVLAYATTERSSPPKRHLFPWLAGGFLMSVTWSYITAQELVALLVSLGYIFGINPSILGLTVLAWGNSIGDLITNLTMAIHGGPEGAQIAISGCYAGPIFNILIGLGLSLVSSSWRIYPSSLLIPTDPYLLETLGFLAGGLVWAFLVLPRRNMKLDGVLGGGLFVIYLIAVSLRLVQTIGFGSVQFHH